LIVCAARLAAHDVITTKITFSNEVSRILYKHCVSCHREKGSAFSLGTYEESRPWAKAIKEEVLSRRMPPWAAIKGFGEFRDDQALTQEDLLILAEWVEGGAPEGDARLVPHFPHFDSGENVVRPAGTAELVLNGSASIKQAVELAAIRPKKLSEGASVKVVAERPDGSVEPIIWIENYRAAFDRTYVLRSPLRLPAGSQVVAFPPDAGSFSLFMAPVKTR
jgi:hypothetical protein